VKTVLLVVEYLMEALRVVGTVMEKSARRVAMEKCADQTASANRARRIVRVSNAGNCAILKKMRLTKNG